MKTFYVYILSSGRDGTLYVGITNDIIRRVQEHKNGIIDGFTKKYHVDRLVYYEATDDVVSAIEYEKRIKRWKRDWKKRLIEADNPRWNDLYDALIKE